MTTGQGASQATWLLTEPTPSWPRPPLPREPTTGRSSVVPGAEEFGGWRAGDHLDGDRRAAPD